VLRYQGCTIGQPIGRMSGVKGNLQVISNELKK